MDTDRGDAADILFEERLAEVGGPAAVIAALRELLDAYDDGDLVSISFKHADTSLTERGIDATMRGWDILRTLDGPP